MRPETWKDGVLEVVRQIADRAYQERAWFGIGNAVSSPEELLCELFDDYLYDDFLQSPDIDMTSEQRELGIRLKTKLNECSASMGDLSDPSEVLDHPRWIEARRVAAVLLDSFK